MIDFSWFDTHVHFEPGADARQLIETAAAAGVMHMIAVGGSLPLNATAIEAAAAFPHAVRLAVGFDRDCAKALSPEEAHQRLDALLSGLPAACRLAAIGEIGLDFHHHPPESEAAQCALLAEMIRAADARRLPFILHTREADRATLAALDEAPCRNQPCERRGVAHSFTGDCRMARELLDRGLYISFSGIVTFRNATMLRETAAYVPADRLLVETDTPYLAPVPLRGRANQPAYVPHIGECIAAVRGLTTEAVARITTANAEALFGI